MAWALQEKSFTFRESRQIVRCILDAMGKALLAGEEVETPFGILMQTEAPPRQERWRLIPGDPWRIPRCQVLFRSRKRIKFKT
jgi:hypothetical protein